MCYAQIVKKAKINGFIGLRIDPGEEDFEDDFGDDDDDDDPVPTYLKEKPCQMVESDINIESKVKYGTKEKEGAVVLNVFFNVMRESDGSFPLGNNYTASDYNKYTDDITAYLNSIFNKYGVFYKKTGYKTYNNDDWTLNVEAIPDYRTTRDKEIQNELRTLQKDDAVTIFLVLGIDNAYGYTSLGSPATIIEKGYAFDEGLIHEIGHTLVLRHTHADSNEKKYQEHIDRTGVNANCSSVTDTFCDTPADPNLLNQTTSKCEYKGGGGYKPDTHNFMSYARPGCKNRFSNE